MKEKLLKYLIEGKFISRIIKHIDFFISLVVKNFASRGNKIEKNKIVFMTYNNSYICNPKYIAEEILRQGLDWDLVWIVPAKGSMLVSRFPQKIRRVRRNSYPAFKEITSAKVWIDNSVNFTWDFYPKKKDQVYIETWHGSMGIKRAGANDVSDPKWVKAARKSGELVDYCISNSVFENGVYNTTHWKKSEKLLYGHPRNDCLFNKDLIAEAKEKVYSFFEIEEDVSVMLYAPTFRDNDHLDCYDIDYASIIESLENRFGGKWKILLRLHFHNRKVSIYNLENIVINATRYPDMQELMMAADAGITDYSSWAYDYVLLRRPLFIYATDLDYYNNERGLYYPLETTPFQIAENNDQLAENIKTFDNEVYQDKIDEFLKKMGCAEDGHAAERVVEKLKEIMV